MAKALDVYRDWLGVTETARPLDYYQLLRLKQFDDATARIRSNYRKMNAHVRKYASGDFAEQSQQLLNELAKAMLCLTDVRRKREYDASLGREEEKEGRRRSFEEILLAGKLIDRDQLDKARHFADAVGLEVRDAVLQQKMASADVVAIAYAESIGLPYVELEDVGVNEKLVPQIPPTTARQHSCVPVMIDEGQLLMASPHPLAPNVEEELRLRFEMPVRTVLCTAASINAALAEHFPSDAPDPAPVAAAKRKAATRAAEKAAAGPASSEDRLKRRLIIAAVTFNVTIVLYMLYNVVFNRGMDMTQYISAAGTGIVVALVAGVIALVVSFVMKL